MKEKYFKVPRDLLTATSIFFDEELNYCTPRKFFLVLDDIDAKLFNTYINVLLESSFSPRYRIRKRNGSSPADGTVNIKFLLRLWRLSKRLDSYVVCLLAEEALISQYFVKFTAQRWKSAFVKSTETRMRHLLSALQKCYTLCKAESIPFAEEFIIACAKCPGQMMATYFDHLDPDFRAEVMKCFAIRAADSKANQRKRVRKDDSEFKALKKRRCCAVSNDQCAQD